METTLYGKFALALPRSLVAKALALPGLPKVPDRYNIAPGQLVEAVYADRHVTRRRAGIFRWGLVPTWAKDAKIGAKYSLARAETVFNQPAFRGAIRYRRCLIPAQGFYVWPEGGEGRVAPYFLAPSDRRVLILAGMFEHWTGPGGEVIDSLAILTRTAQGVAGRLQDRMPVILPEASHAAWIDPLRTTKTDVQDSLTATPPKLIATPVGLLVNSAQNEGPELLTPIGPPLEDQEERALSPANSTVGDPNSRFEEKPYA